VKYEGKKGKESGMKIQVRCGESFLHIEVQTLTLASPDCGEKVAEPRHEPAAYYYARFLRTSSGLDWISLNLADGWIAECEASSYRHCEREMFEVLVRRLGSITWRQGCLLIMTSVSLVYVRR